MTATTQRRSTVKPLVDFPSVENRPLLRIFKKTKFCRKHPVLLENVAVFPVERHSIAVTRDQRKGFMLRYRSIAELVEAE